MNTITTGNKNHMLKAGNWYGKNVICLEKLIREKAFSDNYAVFDWDFTCIFYDTQDNLFMYQLENLAFNLTPQEFARTIRAGIPQDIPLKNCINEQGRCVTAMELSSDLDARYEFLYTNYSGLGGTKSLAEVTASEEYIDFKAKITALMLGAGSVCDTDIAQSVSTGMTVAELEALTEKAIDKGLTDAIQKYTIRSSAVLTGAAGIVQASYRKGVRLQKEIQNLISVLNRNGIETYICSASQEANVRVFASNPKYGYNIKRENIFARRRLLDAGGRFTDNNDFSIPATRREGKAEAVKVLMAPQHGNKPPILIAGDSDGDFFMINEFKHDATVLLFNRNPSPTAKIYAFLLHGLDERKNDEITYPTVLVQNRNDRTGEFLPV